MRSKAHTFIIAKEGWIPLGVAAVFWLASLWLEFLPWVFLIVLLCLIWIYRNPERIPDEEDPLALLSPIDGKICAIEQCKIDTTNEKKLCVRIEGSAYGVGVLRAPCAFTCKELRTKDGLNLPHDTLQATLLNSRIRLECRALGGDFSIGVQVSPLVKKISTYMLEKPLRLGGRFGFGLGAKVSLYLPYNARIRANVGDRVYGGESVLGYFQSER
jgi:phosphatidylserine decarboxylase